MSDVHELYAYLRVHDAGAAIAFYERAFGATELFRLTEPSGRIGHAEIKIGPATLMLADENADWGTNGPLTLGGTTFSMHLHVDNADVTFARAVEAGATILRPLQDQFYGERSGTVRDPLGHEWLIGSAIEAVPVEEMQRRYTALFAS
jgi:uncharacterized glyoxalase superfamily protein PhnB